mgnify:CR=1 FL=1
MDIDRLIPPTEVRQVCRELGLRDWTTLPDRYVFREEAEALLRALAPENTTITVEMFRSGLEEELRHGTFAGPNNSTNNHPLLTARLALSNLQEDCHYYIQRRISVVEGRLRLAIAAGDARRIGELVTEFAEACKCLCETERDPIG